MSTLRNLLSLAVYQSATSPLENAPGTPQRSCPGVRSLAAALTALTNVTNTKTGAITHKELNRKWFTVGRDYSGYLKRQQATALQSCFAAGLDLITELSAKAPGLMHFNLLPDHEAHHG